MNLTRYPAEGPATRRTLLVLAHGAGAGQTHPFMVRYARGLASRGIEVVTFDFPYMEARRRTPDKAPVLEEAFRVAVREALLPEAGRVAALFIGGKSMGGRIATHLAVAREKWPRDWPPIAGVIGFGYPLNPPGGARRQDRVSHLLELAAPLLIVQGTRDSFGGPDDVRAALAGRAPQVAIHPVEDADHSLAVRKSRGQSASETERAILDAVSAWLSRQRTPNGASPVR